MTDDLNKATLKARLRWWLTVADKIDAGTPVSRRTTLVAQSALGQFQVCIFDFLEKTTCSLSSSESIHSG